MLHAFDFDGTLTTRDTLPLFIAHARGRCSLLFGLLLYSPLLVLMKLHLADNGRTKERLFGYFFRGMLERDFDAHCASFARTHTGILRKEGLRTIQRALDNGDYVVVLSASIATHGAARQHSVERSLHPRRLCHTHLLHDGYWWIVVEESGSRHVDGSLPCGRYRPAVVDGTSPANLGCRIASV